MAGGIRAAHGDAPCSAATAPGLCWGGCQLSVFQSFLTLKENYKKSKLEIAHFISADKQLALSIIVTQAKLLLDVFNDWVTFFSCSFCSTLLRDSPSVKTKDSNTVVVLPDIRLGLLFDM